MQNNLNLLAKKIITKNQYVSIATTGKNGIPWISPVVYTIDKNWNLYFVSMPNSKHCVNISENKNIACAIFDSHQKWGQGVGLQIEAESEVLGTKDSLNIAKNYALRKYPYGGINTKVATDFIKSMVVKKRKYRIYKITPKTIWMNDPNAKVDIRVKIEINK